MIYVLSTLFTESENSEKVTKIFRLLLAMMSVDVPDTYD